MNIKQKLALIRVMLYFNAILRKGKISKAAEENGIKQGNLSHLITDFEKSSDILLLQRSNQGVIPTPRGLKISRLTEQLEQSLRELEKAVHPEPRGSIKFCLAPDLNLKNLSQFQKQHPSWEISPCPVPENADIAVLTRAPDWKCEYTTFSTGGNVSQKLWIVCRMDKPEAVTLYDFIIQQLLS